MSVLGAATAESAFDVARLAVLEHGRRPPEDVVRVALHVAVLEVLRAAVRVERVLISDEATVEKLPPPYLGDVQRDRLRAGAIAVLEGEIRR